MIHKRSFEILSHIGILEKKWKLPQYIGVYGGVYWENGKENGSYYGILGLGL